MQRTYYLNNAFEDYSQDVGKKARQEKGHVQDRKMDCSKQGKANQRVPPRVLYPDAPTHRTGPALEYHEVHSTFEPSEINVGNEAPGPNASRPFHVDKNQCHRNPQTDDDQVRPVEATLEPWVVLKHDFLQCQNASGRSEAGEIL